MRGAGVVLAAGPVAGGVGSSAGSAVAVAVAAVAAVGGGALGREVRSWNVWRAVLQGMGAIR